MVNCRRCSFSDCEFLVLMISFKSLSSHSGIRIPYKLVTWIITVYDSTFCSDISVNQRDGRTQLTDLITANNTIRSYNLVVTEMTHSLQSPVLTSLLPRIYQSFDLFSHSESLNRMILSKSVKLLNFLEITRPLRVLCRDNPNYLQVFSSVIIYDTSISCAKMKRFSMVLRQCSAVLEPFESHYCLDLLARSSFNLLHIAIWTVHCAGGNQFCFHCCHLYQFSKECTTTIDLSVVSCLLATSSSIVASLSLNIIDISDAWCSNVSIFCSREYLAMEMAIATVASALNFEMEYAFTMANNLD